MSSLSLVIVGSAFATGPADADCTLLLQRQDGTAEVREANVAAYRMTTALASIAMDITRVRAVIRDGDSLATCVDGVLTLIATPSGAVTTTTSRCDGLAADSTGVFIVMPDGLPAEWHATTTEWRSGEPPIATPGLGTWFTVTMDQGVLVSASYPSNRVRWRRPEDGTLIRSLTLEGVNVPLRGLSVENGVLYVLDDHRTPEGNAEDPEVHAFDAETGQRLGSVSITVERGEYARGLSCESATP